MAKISYKIPVSLNRSLFDHAIPLGGGGMGTKFIPIKVLISWLVSVLAAFWLLFNTGLQTASIGWRVVLFIWWIIATVYFTNFTKTKELTFFKLLSLAEYIPRSSRKILTRRNSHPSGFFSIVGINEIKDGSKVREEDGLILFNDGSYGRAFLVVGSASNLLFDDDRTSILDRVDAFWRKVDVDADWAFITTKQPQRVHQQIASLVRRNEHMQIYDPGLKDILDEQFGVLRDYVGDSFNSIHQYLVIRADNLDGLRKAYSLLRGEVDSSALMFKSCTRLTREDTIEMFASIYRGLPLDGLPRGIG